ncbi:ribosomal oxygenase 1 [Pleurodeles waltl]|uniref:ribosomal oxygenase 1 n=1 Tax=Pleurodeles waltl TaxID=8319 RepID=UPI0037095A73
MEGTRVSAFAVRQRHSGERQGLRPAQHKVNGIAKRKARQTRRRRIKKQKISLSKKETCQVPDLLPLIVNVPGVEPSVEDEVEQAQNSFIVPTTSVALSSKTNKKVRMMQLYPALLKSTELKSEVDATPEAAGHMLKKRIESVKKHKGPSLETVLQDLGAVQNSRERAAKLFEWMISPWSPKDFFGEIWEKRPALIHRLNSDYYKGLFSTAEFDRILRENSLQFGVNLDVTSYIDGKRETHNPPGRALPLVVWDYYKNGCSLRMLNPQSFSVTMWNFLSVLQENFGSMCGANTYLTPAGTQGFAPHYDDIEAFIIQLEGKKHWRVYEPRKSTEILPQYSSKNFSQEEIGEPILDTVLEAGDLLYFPRGFIHQGDCFPDVHSLHVTISSYQKNSWGDLLEKLLPAALQVALEEDVEYRQGLPLDYLDYMGVQNSEQDDPRRVKFLQKVRKLIKKLADHAPVDAGVDQKAKDFMHDCLPPVLTEAEKSCSVHGAPVRWENGTVQDAEVLVSGGTLIRLLRDGIVRLCNEADCCRLYYTAENSRVYHQEEPKYIEVDLQDADAVEFLIHSYPKYVPVHSLPCENLDEKIALSTVLFEKGLLTTKKPLHAS